jgi:peptidyl-prolyl cis-trans isomerase C
MFLKALALIPLLVLGGCDFNRPSLSKKIVLDVNGRQMSAKEFAQELAFRLKDQDALSAKDPKMLKVTKDQISEEFLVQTLSEAWAKDNGVVVKAEEIDAQIAEIQKSYPDDSSFQQAISDQGMTFKAWRERLQNTMLQKLVARKVVEAAPSVTEAEMQQYYNEHRQQFEVPESAQVRQITVATESDAKAMEAELKKGKKMADLAKKYSISPEAAQGGNVGWVEKGLTDIFEPAFRMKQGQRSPVFKSSFGWHIFEVMGRKPSRIKTYSEAKDQIKSILMEKREQSLYLAWLEEQVRKARVFKDQAFIDALKVETKIK